MKNERTKEEMMKRAAEALGSRIVNEVLAASYKQLLAAGWCDADVQLIQNAALDEAKTEPNK